VCAKWQCEHSFLSFTAKLNYVKKKRGKKGEMADYEQDFIRSGLIPDDVLIIASFGRAALGSG
jgi:hypothetical protein